MIVRRTASVSVSKPVDGTRHRRSSVKAHPKASRVTVVRVDSRVMAAARPLLGPGRRLVIVSATEVRIVNRRD
jgi:hypothetical protein